MSDQFQVFFEESADSINTARLEHLASLGLNLCNQRVLEVGAGVGRLTGFFETRNCAVLSTDGRPENIQEIQNRYPHRKTKVIDLETATHLDCLGSFDVVFCYGTLYHLQNPERALQILAPLCQELFLLETCVTPGDELEIYPVAEDQTNPNQAVSGTGCRPTRAWVLATLAKYFEFAYVTTHQPAHLDFDLDWRSGVEKKLHRAVFVGSRRPLHLPTLSASLSDRQTYMPQSYATWIDVGAHQGQSTLRQALYNPALTVYAFEPNLRLAAQLTAIAPNYHVMPMAVSSQDGVQLFYVNQDDAASSLHPLNETARQAWVGGEQLQVVSTLPVSTVRLDTFLEQQQIAHVDFLKIDAQGADFEVVKSLGDRLADCTRIQLEVAITPAQLYAGAATRDAILAYMAERDFLLMRATKQSHDQEENLTFVHRSQAAEVADVADYLETLEPDQVLQLATAIAACRPLELIPGWHFDIDYQNPASHIQARRKVWDFGKNHQPFPVIVNWYWNLKLQLYLGNDLSRQLFISGTYDPNEFYFLNQVLAPGMTVLDIGANEGLYSLFAAQLVGPEGTVLAFEPSQREFERLGHNLALNPSLPVKSLPFGLGDVNTQTELKVADHAHSGQNTLGDFAYENVNCLHTETVSLRRLDDVLVELGIQQVDVIKMDVEGAEFSVLQGAQATLQKYRPLIILELVDQALQNQGASVEKLVELLRGLGYQLFTFGKRTGVPLHMNRQELENTNAIAAHPERLWSLLSEHEQMEFFHQEIAQAQHQLHQAQTRLQQIHIDFEAQVAVLEQRLNQTQAELDSTQQQLAQTQDELSQNQQVNQELQQLVEVSRNRIAAMESSKFWQFRTRWLHIKHKLGLPADE